MTLTNAAFLFPLFAAASPAPSTARFVPVLESGHVAGYRCAEVASGSAYASLGIRAGDVILGVDGEALDDAGTAFEKLGRLGQRRRGPVKIALRRDGGIITETMDGTNGAFERAPATKQVNR